MSWVRSSTFSSVSVAMFRSWAGGELGVEDEHEGLAELESWQGSDEHLLDG